MGVDAPSVPPLETFERCQSLMPQFKIHDRLGDSISSPLQGLTEDEYLELAFDERLLARRSPEHADDAPPRSLAQRLDGAYQDDKLEPEEREFLDRAASQFARRLDDEE